MGLTAANDRGSKRLSTLTARCALAGIALYRYERGQGGEVFVASRCSKTREMRSLDEVECWLQTVSPAKEWCVGNEEISG
jgi:hypothetical protein